MTRSIVASSSAAKSVADEQRKSASKITASLVNTFSACPSSDAVAISHGCWHQIIESSSLAAHDAKSPRAKRENTLFSTIVFFGWKLLLENIGSKARCGFQKQKRLLFRRYCWNAPRTANFALSDAKLFEVIAFKTRL